MIRAIFTKVTMELLVLWREIVDSFLDSAVGTKEDD